MGSISTFIYSVGPWATRVFPEYLYFFWHSSQDVPGGFNTPGYHNPLYDQEAKAFFWSQSPEEARKHAILLQKILEEDLPYVFLAMPLVKEAIRADQLILPYKNVLGGLGYAWPATTIQLRLGE
jgi:ABC-type oligopeptide transport system substrate-binding subunit